MRKVNTETDETIERFFVEAFNYILAREQVDLKNEGLTDLTVVEIHVLDAVNKSSAEKPATMKEPADFLHISKGSLTVSSDRLIKKGYLVKKTDDKDRRRKYLTLTNKGQDVCEVHDQWHKNLTAKAVSQLEENEEKILIEALKKIIGMMGE